MKKRIRGKNNNTYGWLLVAKSEEIRRKHFNDGGFNETCMAANENMKPVLEESEKLKKF